MSRTIWQEIGKPLAFALLIIDIVLILCWLT